MRTRCLVVILLYILTTASAWAIDDPEIDSSNYLKVLENVDSAKESLEIDLDPLDGDWMKMISRSGENYSSLRSSSLDPNSFDPNHVFEYDVLNEKNITTKDQIKLIERDQMINHYQSRGHDESIMGVDHIIFESDSSASIASSDLKFIYENNQDTSKEKTAIIQDGENQIYLNYLDPNTLKRSDEFRQVAHLLGDSHSYLDPPVQENLIRSAPVTIQNKASNDLYQKLSIFETGNDEIREIPPLQSIAEKYNRVGVRDSFKSHLSDIGLIEKTSDSSVPSLDGALQSVEATKGLDLLISHSQKMPGMINDLDGMDSDFLYTSRRENAYQNYAVVVGIDGYDDRMNLHASENDARSVADLLESLGYKVILLSDNSGKIPTKHNILEVALKDPDLKRSKGNIIFYFSGHGLKDEDGTFYLIPKDANGHQASYISDSELKEHLKDLKNLAVIVDACNGGGLSSAIGDGQLIMASSKENEPSNEEWTGSFSIFTQNLCNAIREESRNGDRILLKECFEKAYNDTVKWSKLRMMSQNPVFIDLTHKDYVLK